MKSNLISYGCLIASLANVLALYDKKSPVIQLTNKNFDEVVLKSNQVTLVEFYAPWCGHCKNLKPTYESVAQKVNGLAQIAAIDCDDDKNKGICGEYDIKGFPTIKLFPSSVKTKGKKKRPTDYNGPRTKKAIVEYALEAIPNVIRRITSKEPKSKSQVQIDKFLTSKNKKDQLIPKSILFTDKSKTSNLYKHVGLEFYDHIDFGEIRKSENELVKEYKIETFPTLLLLPIEKDGALGEPIKFEGSLGVSSLKEFYAPHAPNVKTKKSTGSKKSKTKPDSKTKSSEGNENDVTEDDGSANPFQVHLHQITDQPAFEKQCLSLKGHCLLLFTPENQLQNSKSTLEKVQLLLLDLKKKNEIPTNTPEISLFYGTSTEETFLLKQVEVEHTPALIWVYPRKKRYATLALEDGEIDKQVESFVEKGLKGGIKFYEYSFIPKVKKPKKVRKKQTVKEDEDVKDEL